MKQWLLKHWIVPMAIALGVFLLIQIVFSPGYQRGKAKVEELLSHKLNPSDSAMPLLFARPAEALDQDTLATYIALNNITGFKFISYERRETKRMTFEYDVSLAKTRAMRIEFTLRSTDKGWLIERMRRVPGDE